jgi:hypothetical protein
MIKSLARQKFCLHLIASDEISDVIGAELKPGRCAGWAQADWMGRTLTGLENRQ